MCYLLVNGLAYEKRLHSKLIVIDVMVMDVLAELLENSVQ